MQVKLFTFSVKPQINKINKSGIRYVFFSDFIDISLRWRLGAKNKITSFFDEFYENLTSS